MIRRLLSAVSSYFDFSGKLAEQTIRGGLLSAVANVGDRILQIIKLIVLARLLSPEAFGLLGIALLTVGTLKRLSRLGIDKALIQREQENVDTYLDTAWVLKIARGLILVSVVIVTAPILARVLFRTPEATQIIRVVSVLIVIESIQNPGLLYLQKDLDFDKHFVYTYSKSTVNLVVAIAAALILGNVWALVIGNFAGATVGLIGSYLLHGYRPSVSFDFNDAREMIGYGKWLTGAGIAGFLVRKLDDFAVANILGSASLGYYQMAYRFSNAPATELTQVLNLVLFPSYAKMQDDSDRLRNAVINSLRFTTLLSFPVALGILVVTPAFVRAFLGTQWLPMIPAMQILAIWGLFRSIRSLFGPLFQAIGRPDYNFKINFVEVVLMAIAIVPATLTLGLSGAATVVLGIGLVSVVMYIFGGAWLLKMSYRSLVVELVYPAVGSVIMTFGLVVFNRTFIINSPLLRFGLLVILGIIFYSTCILMFERWLTYDIRTIFDTIKQNLVK